MASSQPGRVSIVILGDGGVGKTALTIQLCLNHFIEDSYRKHAIIDNVPCLLEILDTAGQEEYTALRDQWIREGEGFVLVYSITHRGTFDRIERFKQQISRVKDSDRVPIVLVGNKCDRANEREVGRDEGMALAKKLGVEFVETSAKTRVNLELAYYTCVRLVRAQREGNPTRPVKKQRKMLKCIIL